MTDKNNSEVGFVKIANDVIAAYINNTVLNTPGVASFYGGFSDTLSQTLRGKENKFKGIRIDVGDKGYSIDIYLILDFGSRIPAVAWAIQQNVKHDLEEIMFLDIETINIHVQGVRNTKGESISVEEPITDTDSVVFDDILDSAVGSDLVSGKEE